MSPISTHAVDVDSEYHHLRPSPDANDYSPEMKLASWLKAGKLPIIMIGEARVFIGEIVRRWRLSQLR
jgi:hypothetical protein